MVLGRYLRVRASLDSQHPLAQYRSSVRSLSIVIPAYNESANIDTTVRDALRVGGGVTDDLEVLICNDGSSDDTAALLDVLAADDPRVRVLHRRANRGIEASIRALYAAARGEFIFLMSADRQWPMSSLLAMKKGIDQGADLVLGVRRDKRAVYTLYRRVVSYSYERVVRALGAPGRDPGSIKLARADVLRLPVVSRGVFAEGERVIRAGRSGYRVVEVAVDFESRTGGKATGARSDVVVRAGLDVLRVAASLVIGWPRAVAPTNDVEESE